MTYAEYLAFEEASAEKHELINGEPYAMSGGTKYRALPSVKEYVLVSQDRALVEVFRRDADDTWTLRTYGPGARVELASIDVASTWTTCTPACSTRRSRRVDGRGARRAPVGRARR